MGAVMCPAALGRWSIPPAAATQGWRLSPGPTWKGRCHTGQELRLQLVGLEGVQLPQHRAQLLRLGRSAMESSETISPSMSAEALRARLLM